MPGFPAECQPFPILLLYWADILMRHLVLLLLLAGSAIAADVIDRIVVVVGNRVIKSSDITRDLRVTGFLNAEKPEFTDQTRRKSAERLIDQTLIRNQIERG